MPAGRLSIPQFFIAQSFGVVQHNNLHIRKLGLAHMLTIQEIKDALSDRKLTVVSDATGINRNTLAAIRDGQNLNPRSETVRKLSEYLGRG